MAIHFNVFTVTLALIRIVRTIVQEPKPEM